MKPLGFDHIHFTVVDLDEAVGFYVKLGFALVSRMEHGGESAQMASPRGLTIDLHPRGRPRTPVTTTSLYRSRI